MKVQSIMKQSWKNPANRFVALFSHLGTGHQEFGVWIRYFDGDQLSDKDSD